jgi:hypothetical protein
MSKGNFKTDSVIRFKKRDEEFSINNVVMDNYDLDAEVEFVDHASLKSSRINSSGVLKYEKKQYYGTRFVPANIRNVGKEDA